MQRVSLMGVLAVVLCGSIVRADDTAELRAILQLLERRLAAIEQPAARSGERVTEIGSVASRKPVEEEDAKLVVRIYDLSDLFAIAPPYVARQSSDLQSPVSGTLSRYAALDPPLFATQVRAMSGAGASGFTGMGGLGGGGVFNIGDRSDAQPIPNHVLPQVGGFGLVSGPEADPSSGRISFDQLIDTITETIEPTQWEAVGGPGSIKALGNSLIVLATPNMHDQVDNLLDLLRQKWGTLRTVSVEAWWLWMSETQADALLTAARPKGEHAKVFGAVDNAAFAQRLGDLAKDEKARPGYRAKITCYNGQTVHTVSGGQERYVTDLIPIVGNETIAFQPVMSLVQEGAALQVRPHVTRKGKYAAIDVHTRVNLVTQRPAEARADGAPENAKPADAAASQPQPAIDRPQLRNARLSTSLRVPIDQVMLVGAMSFDSDPQAGSENLYLFVKLAMQELRDDLPEEAGGEALEPK